MSLYVGLMSGTSLDGVDAALVRFEGEEERPAASELLAFRTTGYDDAFRDRLERACRGATTEEISALDVELGRRFARAVAELLEDAGVDPGRVEAVGSHGQTVWHAPPGSDASGRDAGGDGGVDGGAAGGGTGRGAAPPPDPGGGEDAGGRRRGDVAPDTSDRGHTLQIGEAAEVAEAVGVAVVSDFRVRDVAAGGHGAPLTPYFDRLLLSSPSRARGIQNLGGMGNLTALPPGGGSPADDGSPRPAAFDTGPGTALLDAAARRLSGGRSRMDRDGRWAAEGEVLPEALEAWRSDPFFRRPPPRSTGRERFGAHRLEGWLDAHRGERREDLLATLTELTAWSVAEALRWLDYGLDEVYLCGGGARNPELRRRLEDRLRPVPVESLSELGWDPDAREAAAFALLARQHRLGVPCSAPWATGAEGARVLGKLSPA